MNNILSVQSIDGSEEIFDSLRHEKFFAISIDKNGKHIIYKNKISCEEIIYAANLVIHSIMNEEMLE